MKWAALSLSAVLTAGCVDLSTPRAYQCDPGSQKGCVGGWRCLKDNYCHAADAGAPVPCENATDCTGGWFCTQAGQCHDPAVGSSFPCADDTQCASGWVCSTELACVNSDTFADAGEVRASAMPVVVHSPWLPQTQALRVSPVTFFANDGQPFALWGAARKEQGRQELIVSHVLQAGPQVIVGARRALLPGFDATDFALAGTTALATDGTRLVLVDERGPRPVSPQGFQPDRLVPLTFVYVKFGPGVNDYELADNPAFRFAALSRDGGAVLISPDGTVESLGCIRDVAALAQAPHDAGARADLYLVTLNCDGGVRFGLPDAGDSYPSAPFAIERLNLDSDVLVLSGPLADGGSAAGVYGDRDGGVTTVITCDELPMVDVSYVKSGTAASPFVACGAEHAFIYRASDFMGGTSFEGSAPVRQAAGVSGGHVRELRNAQLAFSTDLRDEVFDVLPTQPDSVGVVAVQVDDGGVAEEQLHAFLRGALYSKPLELRENDDGGRGGLELSYRLGPNDSRGPVAVVEGIPAVLYGSGFAVNVNDAVDRIAFSVDSRAPLRRVRATVLPIPATSSAMVVVTNDDSLYAGDGTTNDIASLQLRPFPGFDITDWVLRPGNDSSELLEGYAVANNTLLRVTTSGVSRWKSTPIPLTRQDPTGVWFAGESAFVGTATGEVFRLPSRARYAEALPDESVVSALSFAHRCGTTIATSEENVWQLGETVNADGDAVREWSKVNTPVLVNPIARTSGNHLLVADEGGYVLEVPVSCP